MEELKARTHESMGVRKKKEACEGMNKRVEGSRA